MRRSARSTIPPRRADWARPCARRRPSGAKPSAPASSNDCANSPGMESRARPWRPIVPDFIFTPAELANLSRRARSEAFKPALVRLRQEAEVFYAMQLAVPEVPGGYYHDFICPEHGVELRFDPHRPTEHRCPVDEARFTGEKFDAAWRWFVNHHLAEAALRLAVLWKVEGAAKHRDTVRSILLGYAARYEYYRGCPRTGTTNPGAATYTTLDESVWSIPLAWAFSLIAETLPAAESQEIITRLLVPAAEHLVPRRYGAIHNFTCWHNAAIATIGRVAGRADLVAFALEGDLGQRAQLREGLLSDGLWFEGSMSYHFYSVWAILMSALVFRHDPATTITGDRAVPKSLLAPIQCAYPDGTLPATNDCWYFTSILGACCHGVPPAPDFYEIGFAVYGEPAFAATLHRAYRVSPRDSVYALLFGVESLPAEAPPARASVNLPASGLAILRPTEGVDLLLKYGPPGGHHGHPDKLSLTGWAHGWRFSPDLGTPGYGVTSLETWYRQTLSHNTVLIDGESQPAAHGRLEHFDTNSAVAVVDWAGVKLRRAVHVRAEYFVDVFEVECERPRMIDWIYHNAGTFTSDVPGQPVQVLAGGTAFQHLREVGEQPATGPTHVQWHEEPFGMQLWMPGSGGEQVFTGVSPGNPPTLSYGFVLRRRTAARAVFTAVFHPHRAAPLVRNVEFLADGSLVIHLAGRTDRWSAGQLSRVQAVEG
ncbi:MAG: hypothetical protein EXS38_03925 [Opitutus sp.]|nr:hypothetical protein [Opitutus sp.]